MDRDVFLGVDVGGMHISAVLIDAASGAIIEESLCRSRSDSKAQADVILDQWARCFKNVLARSPPCRLKGVGVAMPGPFDYERGICLIEGVDKYERLYGVNIKAFLQAQFGLGVALPVFFENDASCFALGEALAGVAAAYDKVIAITLGTGFGVSFIENKKILRSGKGVAPFGRLHDVPYKDGVTEDYVSARWLVGAYAALSGHNREVEEIARRALEEDDAQAREVFRQFGLHLGRCLAPWMKSFEADCLAIGGSISKAASLFLPAFYQILEGHRLRTVIKISEKMESSTIFGAVAMMKQTLGQKKPERPWRSASQDLMPYKIVMVGKPKAYDRYPTHACPSGSVFHGFSSLAKWIGAQRIVQIDGYIGNDWDTIRERLSEAFAEQGLSVLWYEAAAFLKPEEAVEELVRPFLGEPNATWGAKATIALSDFYQTDKFFPPASTDIFDVVILLGVGAALNTWDAPVIYFDLPRNEWQYRMRAQSAANLGSTKVQAPATMYKRFYFIDRVVLDAHRRRIKERIAAIADGQWRTEINWAHIDVIREGLNRMSKSVLRARPWFEPGVWGGQWMKAHIPGLNQKAVNYAWSFELIAPENGLVFQSDGYVLEIAFDWLMEEAHYAVLGKDAARFGLEFPIRFDFLDTFEGGNLSVQCHPRLAYIQEHFGERITQDETYYILDCKEGASVYLGFQEDIDPKKFRAALQESLTEQKPIEIEKYVQRHPTRKHGFFLIPNGTVHASGRNNLVLEISATPYIFTFKMYDWLRLDLDGKPRPINIDHAFRNLDFERKGSKAQEELFSEPVFLEGSDERRLVHLPTHPEHFYDLHRIEFKEKFEIRTNNQCHVLMLVEGQSIRVETQHSEAMRFHYAETFVIPAAAECYTLINEGEQMAKVIKAFIK